MKTKEEKTKFKKKDTTNKAAATEVGEPKQVLNVIKNPEGKVTHGWYDSRLQIPGRIQRSELNAILDSMVDAGFSKRNLTMFPLQGIVLHNVAVMVSEDTSTEYVIMWTSYNLKEEELED